MTKSLHCAQGSRTRKVQNMEAVRLPFPQFPRDVVQNIRAFASDKMPKHPVAEIWVARVSRYEFSMKMNWPLSTVHWHFEDKKGENSIGLGVYPDGRVITWRNLLLF